MSKNVVVVGAQWGDEGKGKVVDWLTERVDGVVRFNGGHAAAPAPTAPARPATAWLTNLTPLPA